VVERVTGDAARDGYERLTQVQATTARIVLLFIMRRANSFADAAKTGKQVEDEVN
jgi:hypothetical protein